MRISVAAIVPRKKSAKISLDTQILAIDCSKNRGIMLPGGKFEPKKDKTYRHGAARELVEETGVQVLPGAGQLFHHGITVSGKLYIYVYYFPIANFKRMSPTREGIPTWTTPLHLIQQKNCFYTPFFDVIFGDKYAR